MQIILYELPSTIEPATPYFIPLSNGLLVRVPNKFLRAFKDNKGQVRSYFEILVCEQEELFKFQNGEYDKLMEFSKSQSFMEFMRDIIGCQVLTQHSEYPPTLEGLITLYRELYQYSVGVTKAKEVLENIQWDREEGTKMSVIMSKISGVETKEHCFTIPELTKYLNF
ncbi:MAG: hypothetical protein ACRC7S_09755 [Cetobacterium sp.]